MRVLLFFSLVLAFISGGFLFRIKHEVLSLERTIKDMSTAIASNKEEIGILNSEWSYLTNPKRIGSLAKRYLTGFQTLQQDQLVSPQIR